MVNLIAAIQKSDRGLGYQNKLLFRISDDLKRFKELTQGQIVIMGRKTFQSIGESLPNRLNIIISNNKKLKVPAGALVAPSPYDALRQAAASDKEIFIIGGGQIYNETISLADRLYLTIADTDFPADAFFPDFSEFKKIISQENKKDQKTGLDYEYLTLEK